MIHDAIPINLTINLLMGLPWRLRRVCMGA
jgi:hypothetical protein